MPDVVVVVPRAGACPHRASAWQWCRRRHHHPIIEAHGGEPWSKGATVMPVVAALERGTVVVLADADVWCDEIDLAIRAVELGTGWAIPHGLVHRLTEHGTRQVLAGADWHGQPLDQAAYHGIPGGGVLVARCETLLEVPLDARFVGWGQEDESHAMALTAIVGEPWRGTADLLHLWHPPQARLSRRRGSHDGWNLRRRYIRARHDPAQMRALLDEARDALSAHQHALHDRAPHPVG